ncbi:MAG TPA: SiaB family protein kinase [Bacteroidales bacterium]|nr:SiaB family protein kinase [Bacteroidales bacterium]HOK98354.1 SiaB family protein kinase [Bacteroidales bacterium]HPO65221.1 SiaB family protein kinase [Bacteroidales bacterium]
MDANALSNKIVFSYEGPFNMRIISSLGKYLAEYLDASFETRMSLYRVFIEISQNVALYSEDRVKQELDTTVGVGKVVIETDGKSFRCTTTNRIRPEHASVLTNYCQQINEATTNDLIKLKEKLRRESSIKDNGAHIGLISIRLFSKNLLEVSITNEQEHTFFTISSVIS